MKKVIVCVPKRLPEHQWIPAAERAVRLNPLNEITAPRVARGLPDSMPTAKRIALDTKKYWGIEGVRLTVGFLDNPPAALRKTIVSHLNAWNRTGNVKFVETKSDPQVRIARVEDDGYWSYMGTDILLIDPNEQTMNLDSMTMETEDSEIRRVVRHEGGHTLGFEHEHMRKALVARIDRRKAFAFFFKDQGWSKEEVMEQVLTPIEEKTLLGTVPDPKSLMCYQIPGTITKNGRAIAGGNDISPLDFKFVATIYPKNKR